MTKRILLRVIGMAMCIVPVTACILCYFPIWIAEGGETVISGISILLCSLALIPLYKGFKRMLESAAAHTLWLITFILFFLLSRIADEMTVISFVGFVGNSVGAIFLKLANKYKNVED